MTSYASAYLDGTETMQGADAGTTFEGIAILYNIDPTLSPITVVGHKVGADLPDGGSLCPNYSTDSPYWQYTGQIPIQAATVSFFYRVLYDPL